MAPETCYFIFSIIAALVPGIYIANMIYYRLKRENLVGNRYKSGTADYKLMQKHSSNRGLAILGVVTLLGVANLVFDIYRLLHLPNQDDVRFLLVFAPVFVIVIGIAVTVKIYRQFGKGKYKKTARKRDKDDDSWPFLILTTLQPAIGPESWKGRPHFDIARGRYK